MDMFIGLMMIQRNRTLIKIHSFVQLFTYVKLVTSEMALLFYGSCTVPITTYGTHTLCSAWCGGYVRYECGDGMR